MPNHTQTDVKEQLVAKFARIVWAEEAPMEKSAPRKQWINMVLLIVDEKFFIGKTYFACVQFGVQPAQRRCGHI